MIIVLLALILAYRKEDILESRFKILAQNYEYSTAKKILDEMMEEDPEKAKELAEKIKARFPEMPKGIPRVMVHPEKINPQNLSVDTILMLDRFKKTKDTGGA